MKQNSQLLQINVKYLLIRMKKKVKRSCVSKTEAAVTFDLVNNLKDNSFINLFIIITILEKKDQ